MKHINFNWKKLLLTLFLIFLTITIVYGWIGVYITGPLMHDDYIEAEIEKNIRYENPDLCDSLTRNSFQYITYTCTSSKEYTIYDKKANKITSRNKEEAKIEEVEKMRDKYSTLKSVEIKIAYAYDSIAYVIEDGANILVYDFDTLELLFYSGGE